MAQRLAAPGPVAWIFQAAEDEYDLWGAVHTLQQDVWLARESQGARHMRIGQPVFFWKAGPKGGLFATGEITAMPKVQAAPSYQREFWPSASRPAMADEVLRVEVRYDVRLARGAITRADLKLNSITAKQRPIAPTHVGTNFAVPEDIRAELAVLVASARR